MAQFTALDVKRLRDSTGAGMMDAKKALVETDGDFDKAIEILRIKGAAKVAKRGAERTASNGLIAAEGGAMIELNCETDFVGKNEQFQQLAADIVAHAARLRPGDVTELLAAPMADGRTVADAVEAASAVIGEKLQLSRVACLEGQVEVYLHRRSSDLPPQVGVLVAYEGSDQAAARAAAMQVAAMRPLFLDRDSVPEDVVANERRIAEATAREEGKPEAALPKIIEGRMNGFFKETVLLEQSSVQDSKRTVGQLAEAAGVRLTGFVRFEVGRP